MIETIMNYSLEFWVAILLFAIALAYSEDWVARRNILGVKKEFRTKEQEAAMLDTAARNLDEMDDIMPQIGALCKEIDEIAAKHGDDLHLPDEVKRRVADMTAAMKIASARVEKLSKETIVIKWHFDVLGAYEVVHKENSEKLAALIARGSKK